MKAIRVILLIIVSLIFLSIVGLFIFIKSFDINKYLPQIESQAASVLGRTVHIEHAALDLSLAGIILDAGPVSIADDPQFSKEVFAQVKSVHLSLDFMPLIFQRKISVAAVVVQSPDIKIIRTKEGIINAQTMAQPAPTQDSSKAAEVASAVDKPQSPTPVDLPVLMVKSIKVKDASVSFVDYTEALPLNIKVKNMEISVDGFSLTEPFKVVLDTPFYAPQANVHAEGMVTLNLAQASAHISGVTGKADLSSLNLEQVKTITPILASIPMPVSLSGGIDLNLIQVDADAKGAAHLQADLSLNAKLQLKELLNPLDINAKLHFEKDNLIVKDSSIKIGSGLMSIEAVLNDYLKEQRFKFQTVLKDIKVEELVDPKTLPVELSGKISGVIQLSGQGFDPNLMLNTLKGEMALTMSEGIIKKLNIIKSALGHTLDVPGLNDQIDGLIMGSMKDQLGGKEIMIDKANAQMDLKDGLVNIKDVSIETKVFNFNAQGQVDSHLRTEIQTNLIITQALSQGIAKKVKELSYLMDENQNIKIGADITGVIPNLKYTPKVNLKKIVENALMEDGSQQLQKVIEKNPEVGNILNAVFGGSQSSDAQAVSASGQVQTETTLPEESSKEKSKKLINNVLQSILK